MSEKEIKSHLEELVSKGIELRNYHSADIEIREEGEENKQLIVEGVPIVFGQETVLYKGKYWEWREIIEPGALDGADVSDVIFNVNHKGRVYSRTRNNTLSFNVSSENVKSKSIMMSEDEGHQQLYRDIKTGLLDKMSFAFVPKETEFVDIERSDGPNITIRKVKKIEKLYDVSVVDFPAYSGTEISARSIFETEVEKRKEEESYRSLELAKAKYNFY